ncbi:MAG: NAD-dependent oxidoreductase [Proteobacteria bacterium]|nr:MAG: NAD-dependent oxidoreductase [Pseudomonadota bacterium]
MAERYVVVTGAAGALGSVVADTLSRDGVKVIAMDQAKTIPGAVDFALSFPGVDLCDQRSVADVFDVLGRDIGYLSGLVNIAGGFRWETIADGDIATWDRLFNLNLKTALIASKAALPLLAAKGGSIVNISAAASQKAAAGMGAYAASKSAVSRLTEALAEEMKDHGVRVNAVLPSIIDTPANRRDMPQADFSRWVSPRDIANIIKFLLSDDARAVTGALLPVTGRG